MNGTAAILLFISAPLAVVGIVSGPGTMISVRPSRRDALAYIPAQVAGCVLGAITANDMFALAAVSISTHHPPRPRTY